MPVYYEHKRKLTASVPYSFRCEQCIKDSGPLTASISAEATQRSNFKTLSERAEEKLNRAAHSSLVTSVYGAYRDATEKQIFSTDFKDTCPHCQAPQSWAVGGMKTNLFSTPIAILIVGAVVCIGGKVAGIDMKLLDGAAGVTAAAALVSLAWNLIRLSGKKKKTSSPLQENLPNIDWSAVQDLIDERSAKAAR